MIYVPRLVNSIFTIGNPINTEQREAPRVQCMLLSFLRMKYDGLQSTEPACMHLDQIHQNRVALPVPIVRHGFSRRNV